jgi:hypothetical protein
MLSRGVRSHRERRRRTILISSSVSGRPCFPKFSKRGKRDAVVIGGLVRGEVFSRKSKEYLKKVLMGGAGGTPAYNKGVTIIESAVWLNPQKILFAVTHGFSFFFLLILLSLENSVGSEEG